MMMNGFSSWHWLTFLIYAAIVVVPFWQIFPRAGWPSVLSLLMIVPLLNVLILWALAFKRWPGDA